MLENNIVTYHWNDIKDTSSILNTLKKSRVLHIKNVIPQNMCDSIIVELSQWKRTESAIDEDIFTKSRLLNCHLPMNYDGRANKDNFDFKHENISVSAHNFRVGDISALNSMKLREHAVFLLKTFYAITQKRHLKNGKKTEQNLFLEFVHFPINSGHVAPHTHESITEFGLEWNMLGLLTELNSDYEAGGLYLQFPEGEVDMSQRFRKGDLLIIPNNLMHHVTPIQSSNTNHKGRWVCTFFYY